MKIKLILLIAILLFPLVSAGNTYNLDFSEQNEIFVNMAEGDRVEFDLKGDRHTIIIKGIQGKVVDLTAFLNLGKENVPRYMTIGEIKGQNTILKLDVDRDDFDDLLIQTKGGNEEIVSILFLKPVQEEITGSVVGSKKSNYWWIIIPGLIVLILIGILAMKNKK